MSVGKVWRLPQIRVPGVKLETARTSGVSYQCLLPDHGQASLRDLDHVFALARVPSFKVVVAPTDAGVNYLGAGMPNRTLNMLARKGPVSSVWATGGTWDGPRYALGMPGFCREFFGAALPVDDMDAGSLLDDYMYSDLTYRKMEELLGAEWEFIETGRLPWTYFGEHKAWLVAAGFNMKKFYHPEIGYDAWDPEGLARVVNQFYRDLNLFVRPSGLTCFGTGTKTTHLAFNEALLTTAFEGLSAKQKAAILLKGRDFLTRAVMTHPITKLQNCFAFFPLAIPTGERAVYDSIAVLRNIGGSFDLTDFGSIFWKARQLAASGKKPEKLDYVSDEQWQFFCQNVERIIERATWVTHEVMPSGAITQGITDLRKFKSPRDRRWHWSTGLNLVLITGGHKRLIAQREIESEEIDPRWPASAIRAGFNSLLIVSETAAKYLKHRERYFRFEPDATTERIINEHFTSEALNRRFWRENRARVLRAFSDSFIN